MNKKEKEETEKDPLLVIARRFWICTSEIPDSLVVVC
jgi:hypothetical protein